MTSNLDSQTTTNVKPEMIPGVQTGYGIPHDKYNIRGTAHARTNRKYDIFMQRRLYIDGAHTALNIYIYILTSKLYKGTKSAISPQRKLGSF